ncbi:MAG: beta-ketoacyl-ACP synthase II [bacterium]|nr:beta-ketoacyl-ACP synthase II [bacterium]
MKVRAVVTGLGVVSPIGNSIEEAWENMLAGKSGVGLVTRFDTANYTTKIAGEVKNFDPAAFIDKKELRRMDLAEQYALVASELAMRDSGLDVASIDLERAGVVIGSGIGGITTFEQQHSTLVTSGPGRVSPFFIPMMIIDMCAGMVSMRFGFKGPNYATVSACASSAHAIADAFRIVQRGEADVMIAGGAEATITPTSMAGFCQARAMSTRNEEPEKASRPFDKGRDGFVMGEGSALLVIESLEHAQKRGARIYGEILGAGMTADAYHMTAPHPDGEGAARAMKLAIRDAGLKPEQINYINTHGTATDLGDIAETRAIKTVLGEHAHKTPCNSTKSLAGHLLGAAGAIELVACLKSIETGWVHPTINLDDPDPECDLDYVPNQKRKWDVTYAVSNSFGFGGHNVSLVAGKLNGTV